MTSYQQKSKGAKENFNNPMKDNKEGKKMKQTGKQKTGNKGLYISLNPSLFAINVNELNCHLKGKDFQTVFQKNPLPAGNKNSDSS